MSDDRARWSSFVDWQPPTSETGVVGGREPVEFELDPPIRFGDTVITGGILYDASVTEPDQEPEGDDG